LNDASLTDLAELGDRSKSRGLKQTQSQAASFEISCNYC